MFFKEGWQLMNLFKGSRRCTLRSNFLFLAVRDIEGTLTASDRIYGQEWHQKSSDRGAGASDGAEMAKMQFFKSFKNPKFPRTRD